MIPAGLSGFWFFTSRNADSADPGAYYTLGSFDGYRFLKTVGTFLPIDGGHDFYATQSWTNMGPEDERRVWIAWSANPAYAPLAANIPLGRCSEHSTGDQPAIPGWSRPVVSGTCPGV